MLRGKALSIKEYSRKSFFFTSDILPEISNQTGPRNACVYCAKKRYAIVAHLINTGIVSACCIRKYLKQNNFYTAELTEKRQTCAM